MFKVHTIAAVLTVLATSTAYSQGTQSFVGHWEGYGISDSTRQGIAPCMDIGTEVNNGLRIELGIAPCMFPVDARVSETGVITGNGVDEHGHRVLIQGKAVGIGDGSSGLAVFSYRVLEFHGGVRDVGRAAFVQLFGGKDWREVAEENQTDTFMQGGAVSEGHTEYNPQTAICYSAQCGTPRTETPTIMVGNTKFIGVGSLLDPNRPPFDVVLDMVGSVSNGEEQPDESTQSAVVSIGWQAPDHDLSFPDGVLGVFIGKLIDPAEGNEPRLIKGEYRLYNGFDDLFKDLLIGTNSSFDFGTFLVKEPQGDPFPPPSRS